MLQSQSWKYMSKFYHVFAYTEMRTHIGEKWDSCISFLNWIIKDWNADSSSFDMMRNMTCPNVCRREQRDKQDVYDYGAVLLEMVLGRPPTIRNPFPQKRSELVNTYLGSIKCISCSILSIIFWKMQMLNDIVEADNAIPNPSVKDVGSQQEALLSPLISILKCPHNGLLNFFYDL